MKFLLLAVLCIFTSVKAQSDTRMTPEEYIAKFKDAALQDMKKTGVPNGLKTIGFGVQDVEELVEGTLP